MVDVFDEVEEELRKDKYNEVFRKWAPWVIGGAVAIVVGVAGWQYWIYQSNASAEAASNAYIGASELFEDGELDAARTAFTEMAETGSAGYATLSYMRLGEIALSENDAATAAGHFEQAAARAPEPLTRQLAQYKAALALFDTLSYDDLSVRLTPLTEGEALFGELARELIAAAALRDERWDEARSQYQLIRNTSLDLQSGMARRAAEALVYIEQNAPSETANATAETASVEDTEPATENGGGELDATEASSDDSAAQDSDTEEGGQ